MTIQEQIHHYIDSQPEPKRNEMQQLHELMLTIASEGQLWFFDGKNSANKTVANPTIGYGLHTIHYASKASREIFKIGLSANKAGISVHILGIKDKIYLAQTFGARLGKADITGYCVKFKTLNDIHLDVLEEVLRYGIGQGQ